MLSDQPPMIFSWPVVIKLVMCAVALGFGYAAWNVGILHGNVSLLAAASYFTPVLSSALAAVLLSAALSGRSGRAPVWFAPAPCSAGMPPDANRGRLRPPAA
jgi:drug/metabolite transporter (DMT)-like permease